jgi:ferrochelatase
VTSPAVPTLGILLMAHGSPDRLEDVPAFLQHIRGGRPTPQTLVEEIREHYRLIGGRSPLLDLTRAQAAALEERLNRDGRRFRVYVGMRNWHPFIKDAVQQMVGDGLQDVIALSLAPQYSHLSVGAYQQALARAQAELGVSLNVRFVESWHRHPLLLEAFAERVQDALGQLRADARDPVSVIFTAHSLPERVRLEGDPYSDEVERTAQGVAAVLGLTGWTFAYQSHGATPEPWLGPSLGEVFERCAAHGQRQVLVVPIGFVCDHMEILYDLDIVARRLAAEKGLSLTRTVSLNTSPRFIEALADVVQRAL